MIDRVKANPKLPQLERVVGLHTLLYLLDPLPVLLGEHSIIEGYQGGTLELPQLRVEEISVGMLPVVHIELDTRGPSIVSILNHLL